MKYNRDGGTVTVRGVVEDGWLRIDVEDTGIGIAEENLARVWDEFFREKRAETASSRAAAWGWPSSSASSSAPAAGSRRPASRAKVRCSRVLLPA